MRFTRPVLFARGFLSAMSRVRVCHHAKHVLSRQVVGRESLTRVKKSGPAGPLFFTCLLDSIPTLSGMAVSSKIEILLYCLLESLDVLTRPTGHALGTVHGMHGLSPSLQERSAYLVRRGLVDIDNSIGN